MRKRSRDSGARLRSWSWLALLGVSFAAGSGSVGAYELPSIERGLKPERYFQNGDIDRINLLNGGLTLAIPIGPTYSVGLGAELSYRLMLTYSSQVWDYIGVLQQPPFPPLATQAWPGRVANAGLGWRLSLGDYWDSTYVGPGRCSDCYISPDGAQHPFYDTLHPDVADDSSDTLYTRDGTYLRLHRAAREIDFPNGEIHTFDSAGRLIQIRNRLGSTVNVSYGPSSWTITDGSRTQTVNLIDAPYYGKVIGSVVLAAFNGVQATYTFSYAEVAVPRSCLDDDFNNSDTITLPLLTSVTLPDGSSYEMPAATSYVLSSNGPCGSSNFAPPVEGLLTSVKLPTRGIVSWTYQAYNFPVPVEENQPEPPLFLAKTAGVATRTLSDANGSPYGTWSYLQILTGGQSATEAITQVTTPLGDRTDHYFLVGSQPNTAYGLPYSTAESAPLRPDLFRSTKVYDCNAGGSGCVLKRTTYLKYRTDTFAAGAPEFNPRVEASYVRFHDDSDHWLASDFSSFDGLGHYRVETLSGNFGSGDAKTITTNFNPTRGTYPGTFNMPLTVHPWVLGTFDFRRSDEGTKSFRSDYCYDTSTGFLERVRGRKSNTGAAGTNDIVTTFTREAANQKVVERHYGGDLAIVGTGGLCSLSNTDLGNDAYRLDHTFQHGSLKLSQYSTTTGGLVLNLEQRTIDANTGLVATSRDAAGVLTTYVFDPMGRVVEIRPAEDAWIGITYIAPISSNALIKVRSYPNGVWTGQLTDEEIQLDDLGRVVRERRRTPSGAFARRTTAYDVLSQVTDISEWQADANNTAWTRLRNFDPFGRPGFIDPPEGSGHRVQLGYTGAREATRTFKVGTALVGGVVSESSVTVTQRFDRQGRLSQVVDGGGTTSYGYDAAGNLTSVSMPGQGRAFDYDGRGFLSSESHPEKGLNGNGTIGYSRYDALGNVGSRSDGGMSVDYVYDRAGRLLRVTEPGASGANLKVFTYGTGTTAADRSAGRIKIADRYNYVMVGTTPFTVQVQETYTYAGRSGRASKRDTQIITTTNNTTQVGESFTQTFGAYDFLGNLTSLTYPECTHAGCNVSSPRTQAFTYQDGRVIAVPGWAPSITYHPNGMMASVTHSNGVVVSQANDDNSRPRPKSISTTGAFEVGGLVPANWSSGTYVYDGAGNVTQIGSSRFLYNSLSRLTSAAISSSRDGNAATDKSQSYTYDVRGNMTSINTNGTVVNTPVSATTNRLTGAVQYDNAGNLILWNLNNYSYDRLGKMWRMQAGSIEDLYIYTADDERLWTFHVGQNRSTWTLRDLGGRVLREFESVGTSGTVVWTVDFDYIYREGALLGAATPTRKQEHFALDHLGTPRLRTVKGGELETFHAYYPFGQEATPLVRTTQEVRMKFTGHERDLNATAGADPAADDLDNMHARFYNPNLARFMSVDPAGGDPANPQSWNRYAYVLNNPLRFVDPDGRDAKDTTRRAVQSIGAAGTLYRTLYQAARAGTVITGSTVSASLGEIGVVFATSFYLTYEADAALTSLTGDAFLAEKIFFSAILTPGVGVPIANGLKTLSTNTGFDTGGTLDSLIEVIDSKIDRQRDLQNEVLSQLEQADKAQEGRRLSPAEEARRNQKLDHIQALGGQIIELETRKRELIRDRGYYGTINGKN